MIVSTREERDEGAERIIEWRSQINNLIFHLNKSGGKKEKEKKIKPRPSKRKEIINIRV